MRRMDALTARQIIRKVYGKPSNSIYPNLISIGKINREMAYELRSGEGAPGKTLYHVSIAVYNQDTREIKRASSLNEQFNTLALAKKYIQALKHSKGKAKSGDRSNLRGTSGPKTRTRSKTKPGRKSSCDCNL